MVTGRILKSLNKGEQVTYLYISSASGLPCCLKGFITGSTDSIGTKARRFLLVKGNSKGKYIEEGEGYILKGWHDIVYWETLSSGEKMLNANVDLFELIKMKGLDKVLLT